MLGQIQAAVSICQFLCPGTLLYIYMTDDGTCISDDVTCISDDAHAYLMMAHAYLIAHTHTLDAPVCSKLRTFECESAPKNRLVRCRCARPRAELPGVDARRARGCRHAASRSRRACTLPCPLLCPACRCDAVALPCRCVCSLCVRNGHKRKRKIKRNASSS